MTSRVLRVLVVEDEEIAATAHAAFVERVPGFALVGAARSCAEARRILRREPADLLLLDMHLPDGHGLDLLAQLRLEGHSCDAVAVTSVRELDVVHGFYVYDDEGNRTGNADLTTVKGLH